MKENCCFLRSQHKGKLDEKFRSLPATCTIIYLEIESCGIYLGKYPCSLFWRRAFCLIHESSMALHLINPGEEPELCSVVMGELTLGAEHPSYCCCWHHSCFIFCLQSWTDQFLKNQFSLVSRQLFLNFWMDYASFIFCNRFNSNLIIGQHSTGVENIISQTLWSLDTFPLKTYWVFKECSIYVD